jgi:hypothetical protein
MVGDVVHSASSVPIVSVLFLLLVELLLVAGPVTNVI